MDENIIECSKRSCDDNISCSPVQLKKRKLNDSESLEPVTLSDKDCPVENTSNTPAIDFLEQRLNNNTAEANYSPEVDQNDTIKETPNDADASKPESTTNILSLSNDILLFLLSYLNSSEVFYLSQCHPRLFHVCGDKSQWIRVNVECDGRYPPHDEQMLLFFHQGTTHLRFVKSNQNVNIRTDNCFRREFFKNLTDHAPNLQSLIIENHSFNTNSFLLKYLPNTLTELRLPNLELLNFFCKTPYFQDVDAILPNLEILDLSYCHWFTTHAMMALAKCNNLKELRLTGCRNLKDFIPYVSLATAFGFKKLETLDLRLTDIVDREIACFNKTKSLKHIYLEKPSRMQNRGRDESVTDMCITSFSKVDSNADYPPNMVLITRIPNEWGSYKDHTLETLVIRNYPGITDITLKHARKCLQSLKYLDVTGCSCTLEQASIFKVHRPEVKLIYNDVAM